MLLAFNFYGLYVDIPTPRLFWSSLVVAPKSFRLFERSWKKMKIDTIFVRMRNGGHLGDAQMSKKDTPLHQI